MDNSEYRVHPKYVTVIWDKLTAVQRNSENSTLVHEIARIKSGIRNYRSHVDANYDLPHTSIALGEYVRSAEMLLDEIAKESMKGR